MSTLLADFDALDALSPRSESEAKLGRQATLRLLELLNAGPFALVHPAGRDEDRYGRELRVIERDGQSLGVPLT